MMQMANENLKAQKIYGKYIKDLPQVTEVNDTDDIIIEDSTPITSRVKLGVLFDSIKKRIASTWRFAELNNKTIVEYASELNKNITCSPSAKRQETLVSFQKNVKHKIEHTGQIQFAAAFSSTAGYCRFYVYNSSGEIVYREQLNPAPVPANEVTTGQLQVYDGWEFLAESSNALVANMPKYTLAY